MIGRRFAKLTLVALLVSTLVPVVSCTGELSQREPPEPEFSTKTSNLTVSAKRERAKLLKRVAASEGLDNAIVLAGIAEAETDFAHCWNEATTHCKGPHSSYCGGPVLAGSADGSCGARQGGLGMFQFDGGTYRETLRRDGRQILSLEGSIRHAIDFITDKVERSRYIAGVETRAEAIDWLNGVEIGGDRYGTWLKTVVAYYNGCFPGQCGAYQSRYNYYDNSHRNIYSSLGASFWKRAPSGGTGGSSSGSQTAASGPAEPSGVGPNWAKIANGGTVDLDWNAVGSADAYVVHMDVERDGNWRDYYEWRTGDAGFRVWPQRNDSEYRWRIKACGGNGCSSWTDFRAFAVGDVPADSGDRRAKRDSSDSSTGGTTGSTRPEPDPLSVPNRLGPDERVVYSSKAELEWNGSGGAAGYVVQVLYRDAGTGRWRHYDVWSDVGRSSMDLWPMFDGRNYAWRVRACDRSRCTNWSGWATFYFDG